MIRSRTARAATALSFANAVSGAGPRRAGTDGGTRPASHHQCRASAPQVLTGTACCSIRDGPDAFVDGVVIA
jgi:hypothetical protein